MGGPGAQAPGAQRRIAPESVRGQDASLHGARAGAHAAEGRRKAQALSTPFGGFSVRLALQSADVTARQAARSARQSSARGSLRVTDLATERAMSTRTIQNDPVAPKTLGLAVRVGRVNAARKARARG